GDSVVLIDGYERLGLLDDWVRDELVPALPAASTTLVVSRRPPNAGWRSDVWRGLLAELEIGPLDPDDAAELVERRVGGSEVADSVLRFGRGHPLALQLAADEAARRGGLVLHDGPPPAVIEELVNVFLEDLPADLTELIEDLSLLRRVTPETCEAVLD